MIRSLEMMPTGDAHDGAYPGDLGPLQLWRGRRIGREDDISGRMAEKDAASEAAEDGTYADHTLYALLPASANARLGFPLQFGSSTRGESGALIDIMFNLWPRQPRHVNRILCRFHGKWATFLGLAGQTSLAPWEQSSSTWTEPWRINDGAFRRDWRSVRKSIWAKDRSHTCSHIKKHRYEPQWKIRQPRLNTAACAHMSQGLWTMRYICLIRPIRPQDVKVLTAGV